MNSCKQWTNDNYTKLHCTFSGEQIIFLSFTLLKLVASSLKEKKPTSLSNVADTFRQ